MNRTSYIGATAIAFENSALHLLCSCLKLASRLLLRSRLTTPHPCGAKATLLAKLTYSRRQFSPLRGSAPALSTRHPQLGCALYAIVHPTSYIGRLRLPPPLCNHDRSSHQKFCVASASLPRATRANLQIVHRTSSIVHRRRQALMPRCTPITVCWWTLFLGTDVASRYFTSFLSCTSGRISVQCVHGHCFSCHYCAVFLFVRLCQVGKLYCAHEHGRNSGILG